MKLFQEQDVTVLLKLAGRQLIDVKPTVFKPSFHLFEPVEVHHEARIFSQPGQLHGIKSLQNGCLLLQGRFREARLLREEWHVALLPNPRIAARRAGGPVT